MIEKNAHPNQTDDHAISAPASSGVWAWLFWLRRWFACYYGGAEEQKTTQMSAQGLSRKRRHSRAYFARCALPPARDLSTLRTLLPRGLSPTQSQERLARISVLGRVRIYLIPAWGSVLVRRAMLVCYDHGWWRAPMYAAEAAALHPP